MIDLIINAILIAVIGYVLGAIPTAALIAQKKGIDITKYGSGNSGATNIGRSFGASYFLIVFFVDSFKACFFLLLLQKFAVVLWLQVFGALMLLLGNGFSCFLHWKGGKGISTSVGIVSALVPHLLFILLPLWFLLLMLLRTVGIASALAAAALPIIAFFHASNSELLFLCFFISCWCLIKHMPNIKRFIGIKIS